MLNIRTYGYFVIIFSICIILHFNSVLIFIIIKIPIYLTIVNIELPICPFASSSSNTTPFKFLS